jgi:hypothetical protein
MRTCDRQQNNISCMQLTGVDNEMNCPASDVFTIIIDLLRKCYVFKTVLNLLHCCQKHECLRPVWSATPHKNNSQLTCK